MHPGQLDADRLLSLALYRGFGDPQLIDAFFKDPQVLHHAVIDEGVALLLGHGQSKALATARERPASRSTRSVTSEQRIKGRNSLRGGGVNHYASRLGFF